MGLCSMRSEHIFWNIWDAFTGLRPCSAVTAQSMHLLNTPFLELQPKGLRQLCVALVQDLRQFLMMQKPVNRLTIAAVSKSGPAQMSAITVATLFETITPNTPVTGNIASLLAVPLLPSLPLP